MRKTTLIVMNVLTVAGLLNAQEVKPVTEVTGADELVETKGALENTWVRPDADMTRYGKLLLWAPEFQFREGGETRAETTTKMLRGDGGPYAVRPEDQERFQKLVSDTFVAELERSKMFAVVDTPVPGTLIVRAGFVDITSDEAAQRRPQCRHSPGSGRRGDDRRRTHPRRDRRHPGAGFRTAADPARDADARRQPGAGQFRHGMGRRRALGVRAGAGPAQGVLRRRRRRLRSRQPVR